jgi:methylated-DNA-[protein]-cysteine S-methyltransferase
MNPLAALPQPDPTTMARLHARLADAAAAGDILDIAYRTIDTPLGPLLLAATAAGLVRVAYESEGHDGVLAALAARVSPRVLRAPGRLDHAAREIDDYFTGRRHHFDLPLDLQLARGFRREVLGHLRDIVYGTTASYAAVAAAAGRPTAVRAVGTACAVNPLPIVIPCHRVVRSDGSLGGYLGGAAAKQALLSLESATARPHTRPAGSVLPT